MIFSPQDAHNCLPEFDPETSTSLFAVYDGHGGSEVAQYCAEELPNYLVKMPTYHDGNDLSDSLIECFLGFDACLLEEQTIEYLRRLKGEKADEEEEEDDASALKQEADLPLENVLEKYGGVQALPPVLKTLMMVRKKHEYKSPRLSAKSKRCTPVEGSGDKAESTMAKPSEEDQAAAGNSKQDTKAPTAEADVEESKDENGKNQTSEPAPDETSEPLSNGIDSKQKTKANEKQIIENCNGNAEKLKNGTKDEIHENGVSEVDSAPVKLKTPEKITEDDESDDEWNGEAEADEGEDEDEDEDEDDEVGIIYFSHILYNVLYLC